MRAPDTRDRIESDLRVTVVTTGDGSLRLDLDYSDQGLALHRFIRIFDDASEDRICHLVQELCIRQFLTVRLARCIRLARGCPNDTDVVLLVVMELRRILRTAESRRDNQDIVTRVRDLVAEIARAMGWG